MVYQNKVVACIKVNGEILREQGNEVKLPFGSEYSVLIKNLNSVRVQVKVSVDDQDATEGTWLVVDPNSSLELERFIRNGNLEKGNRFKFIKRTNDVEEYRGIKVEDGLVRVEYQTEKVTRYEDVHIQKHYCYDYDYRPYSWPRSPYYPPYRWPYYGDITYTVNSTTSGTVGQSGAVFSANVGGLQASKNLMRQAQDQGITVPGSESQQKFQTVSGFSTHPSEVIVLHLIGEVAGKTVKKVVTTKSKNKCRTCGKVSKSSNQFCANCGTALELI